MEDDGKRKAWSRKFFGTFVEQAAEMDEPRDPPSGREEEFDSYSEIIRRRIDDVAPKIGFPLQMRIAEQVAYDFISGQDKAEPLAELTWAERQITRETEIEDVVKSALAEHLPQRYSETMHRNLQAVLSDMLKVIERDAGPERPSR